MPNKYSHALVLSHYERRGLIGFDQPHYSQPPPLKAFRSSPRSVRPIVQSSRPTHVSSPPNSTGRIRIASPSPPPTRASPPPTRASPPSLRRRSSSIETQIFAPARSPSPILRHELEGSQVEARDFYVQPRTPSRPSTADSADHFVQPRPPSRPSTAHDEDQSATADIFDLYNTSSPISQNGWSNSSAVKAIRRASWASRPSSSSGFRPGSRAGVSRSPINDIQDHGQLQSFQPNSHGSTWIEDQVLAPRRPPSPPATPESDRSFSIGTKNEHPEQGKSLPPPPLPDRSPRRTPPRASSTHPSAELPPLKIQTESTGIKVFSTVHSPTFSISTRKSSFDAFATSPTSSNRLQHQPESRGPRARSAVRSPTFSMTTRKSSFDNSNSSSHGQPWSEHARRRPSTSVHSPHPSINTRTSSLNATTSQPNFSRVNPMPEKIFVDDDDADLESLPSTLDFNVLPWAEQTAGSTVFRGNPPVTSPPATRPLSLISTRASSFDSAAPPPIRLRGSIIPRPAEKPLPKTPKQRLSSMLFSRLGPKAVPYSETAPGQPPVPVSVSRTAAPSIPALFPKYQGQFPPPPPPQPEKEVAYIGRRTRDSSTSRQTRGRSVPPKSPGDKRKSWFKSAQVDRVLGRGQPVIEKNIQEILKANQAAISG